MKKQKLLFTLVYLITFAFSFFNGLGVVSLTIGFVTILIKTILFVLTGYIIHQLIRRGINLDVLSIIVTFIVLPFSIVILKIHRQFMFFPCLGDYQLKAVYNQQNLLPKFQNRLEYYEKSYGINNTSIKYEEVCVYGYFFEFRKVKWVNEDELDNYSLGKYYNDYQTI